MFQFWVLTAVISTLIISVITTDEAECDRRCRAITGHDIQYLTFPDSPTICECNPASYRLYDCGSGKIWSEFFKSCVDAPPSDDTAVAKGCIEECPEDCSTTIPHRKCSKYCQCTAGVVTVKDCPRGFYFSVDASICVSSRDTMCIGEKDPSPRSSRDGCIGACPLENAKDYTDHLPHESCKKFCKCNWGTAVVLDCPETLEFNPVLQVCDWPWHAGCTGSKD